MNFADYDYIFRRNKHLQFVKKTKDHKELPDKTLSFLPLDLLQSSNRDVPVSSRIPVEFSR